MATEEYAIGYQEGRQAGWNSAMDSLQPQRPWVGLTDEEVAYFSYVLDHWTTTHIRAIEALLKAKNERL